MSDIPHYSSQNLKSKKLIDSSWIEMSSSNFMFIALKFNEKINQQDLEGLVELMTADHTFTDNSGEVTKGKDVMKESWREFFKKYPDYRNHLTSAAVQNDVVVMVGYSSCSYKPLDGPSIWAAKVSGGLISEWRVHWLDQRLEQV